MAFSYNGRCSTNVEFFGFILFRSMFGGSVVEWSELLIKVFISCRFQAKSFCSLERLAFVLLLILFYFNLGGNLGQSSITRGTFV